MSLDPATKDARQRLLLQCTLAVFFGISLWLNYPLDEDAHFVFSHLATMGLLALSPFLALTGSKIQILKPWGSTADYVLWIFLLAFFALRMLLSVGNQFFFGQASKIMLVIFGWICFKTLDPKGKLLQFFAIALPAILAMGFVIGILVWIGIGKIGVERLRIGPNDYEYVSEYAGLILPLILFSLDDLKESRKSVPVFLIFIIVIVGLVLTGARGPLLGSMVAMCAYLFVARRRMSKKLSLGLIFTFAIIVFTLGPTAYSADSTADSNRFSIGDSTPAAGSGGGSSSSDDFFDPATLNTYSSGRWSNWAFLTFEMLDNTQWIIFGSGLGQLAEWIPEQGGYYRPAITNGLLSAWVPFGVIGVLGYIYFNIYLWRRMKRLDDSPYRCMAISLFLTYIVTDQLETHWQGTNMLWYVSFVLYLLTLARPQLPQQALNSGRLPGDETMFAVAQSDF